MTVERLIEYLKTIPPHLPVYATCEGVFVPLTLNCFEVEPEIPTQYSSWSRLPERLEIFVELL